MDERRQMMMNENEDEEDAYDVTDEDSRATPTMMARIDVMM